LRPEAKSLAWQLVDSEVQGDIMKNPLDSLSQTIVLGLVLTVIVVILVKAIS
jgi:hypothetical protein